MFMSLTVNNINSLVFFITFCSIKKRGLNLNKKRIDFIIANMSEIQRCYFNKKRQLLIELPFYL
jgi:hypothetical protein